MLCQTRRIAKLMTVSKIVPGVWRAGTRYVNWYIIDGGQDGVTLVDAGLPAYRRQLDESFHQIGRSRSVVRAVVLTHGHIDHIKDFLWLSKKRTGRRPRAGRATGTPWRTMNWSPTPS